MEIWPYPLESPLSCRCSFPRFSDSCGTRDFVELRFGWRFVADTTWRGRGSHWMLQKKAKQSKNTECGSSKLSTAPSSLVHAAACVATTQASISDGIWIVQARTIATSRQRRSCSASQFWTTGRVHSERPRRDRRRVDTTQADRDAGGIASRGSWCIPGSVVGGPRVLQRLPEAKIEAKPPRVRKRRRSTKM